MRRVVLTEHAARVEVPRLDARLDATSRASCDAGAALVAGHFVPHFQGADERDMVVEELKGGITNKLLCVSLASDASQRCLVRIYGESTEYLIDRSQELVVMQQSPVAPKLYGTFKNGYVYNYTPGRTVKPEEIREPAFVRLMAEACARLHASDVPGISREPRLFAVFEQWLGNVPREYTDPAKQEAFKRGVDVGELRAEVAWLQREVEAMGCQAAFCHNDLLLPNILYDEAAQKVNFIDWEYSSYSYAAHDIANHFCEWAGFECRWELFPSEQQQREFLRHYLRSLHPGDDYAAPDDEVEAWVRSVRLCELGSHLFWGVWALIQAELSAIDFDYLSYALQRFQRFRERKELLR
eukprot:m51a1_g7641 putative choline ethanolamine (354) ;mRNA; f:363026-364782